MSFLVQPFDVFVKTSGTFDPQLSQQAGAVVFFNLSPNDLVITPPNSQKWIAPANSIRIQHYEGGNPSSTWLWAQFDQANNIQGPYSTVAAVEALTQGVDDIPPDQIIGLTRQAAVGQVTSVATVTQVQQDGQPVGQMIVESTPTDGIQHIFWTTDGHLILKGVAARLDVTPDTTTGNDDVMRFGPDPHSLADWFFILVNNGDLILWDNKSAQHVWRAQLNTGIMFLGAGDLVNADASGNLTAAGVFVFGPNVSGAASQLSFDSANHHINLLTPQAGASAQAIEFVTWDGAAQKIPFAVGGPAFAQAYVDNGGTMFSQGRMTLLSGKQDSGKVGGGSLVSNPSGVGIAQNMIYFTGNFAVHCVNIPSSITLVADVSNNGPTLTVSNIDRDGFHVAGAGALNPGAMEQLSWQGRYTTVGNCIRAVDPVHKTFDHHCDGCDLLRRDIAFAELRPGHPFDAEPAIWQPGGYGVSYVCPTCGQLEAFNTGLTFEDELADASGHSRLVNELLDAAGLPTRVSASVRAQLETHGGI